MQASEPDRLLPAAHGLQLHYDTPHQMICLDSCRRLARACKTQAGQALREYLADYIEGEPQLLRPAACLSAQGRPDAEDDIAGMRASLAEGKVFNATFYALHLSGPSSADALTGAALELAAREVDGLGHVFIYTDSALRLAAHCQAEVRAEILLSLMEFLSRKALHQETLLLQERSGLPALIARATERVGLLGHNIIYARSLVLREGDLDDGLLQHARAQLARNIDDSEDEFTAARLRKVAPLPPDGPPRLRLPPLAASGDEEAAMGAVRGYVAEGTDAQDIVDGLVLSFCQVDVRQPHYLIFPEAVLFLCDCMEAPQRELALAQLARMAADASRRYGVRDASAQGGR
jgi:hypothetical protein